MIRARASASRSSSVPKQPYRGSLRAVAPLNRRSRSNSQLLSQWNFIKATILIAGTGFFFFFVYPLNSQNQKSTIKNDAISTDQIRQQIDTGVVSDPLKYVSTEVFPKVDSNMSPSEKSSLARGLSGLPMEQTPALIGASRGHINCDTNVDTLVYWNDPQGDHDRNFKSPFALPSASRKPKYITFEPDRGGWNNIRMNLEFIFIFAAATGRTLVLPPAAPLYLMNKDKEEKHKGFGDFFPLHTKEFDKRVTVITMEEFLEIEGGEDGQFPIPEQSREDVYGSAKECDKRAKSDISCDHVWNYLEASALVPQFNTSTCIVFDEDMFENDYISEANKARVNEFCSPRKVSGI